MTIRSARETERSSTIPKEFSPFVRSWFKKTFRAPSPPQEYAFPLIHKRKNLLISAPTGSGKTLSAFLSMINHLFELSEKGVLKDEMYVLYISPLRALSNDIHRNLEEPLAGILEEARKNGKELPPVRSGVRTGDTSAAERARHLRKPPHILITTPESLALILSAPKFSKKLESVQYVIIDEVHALSENKRGTHLSLSLERLEHQIGHSFTRIGLSATQAPIEKIATFLVGYKDPEKGLVRDCIIVNAGSKKELDISVHTAVEDLIFTDFPVILEATYTAVHEQIQKHKTTLVFTNTRAGTERIVHQLKQRWPDHYNTNIGAHHSSMSRETRFAVEEQLKRGELKVVVTSTSLELGIDIGSIDLVIQIGSPKGIARAIQRIGRSGHHLFDTPKGRILISDRDDALECLVLCRLAKEHKLDKVRIPTNCLDVLSQHVIGMALGETWKVDDALALIRRAMPFYKLTKEQFVSVLKYVAGHYAKLEDQNVYGKIWYDEKAEEISPRGRMTRLIYMTNMGTIPDESSFQVRERSSKKYVGSLDEEFLDRLRPGDIFVLGGKTYEFRYARGMKVYVEPRPHAKPTVPSWFSEMLPLSFELGREIAGFTGDVEQQLQMGFRSEDILRWIREAYYADENTAKAVLSYVKEQKYFAKYLPSKERILCEYFFDDQYRWNYCFHTFFGRRVNDALARVLADILSALVDTNVAVIITDHGFVLISGYRRCHPSALIDELTSIKFRDALRRAVRKTELMKRRFRHVATRSLMILRSYKGRKKTVGKQQMNAHFLLTACEKIDPNFPILEETYREIMEDYMDVQNAIGIVDQIRDEDIMVTSRQMDLPSPFAHQMLLQGESDVLLMANRKKRIQEMHKLVLEKIERERPTGEVGSWRE